jgi:predicted permease
MTSWLRRLRNRLRYRAFERDLQDELAFHRDMKRRELDGASEDAVSRAMGNERVMRERAREVWVPPTLEALVQDLRDAWRSVSRRRGLTAATVAALVSGVGAATLTYAFIHALLLRPLPVERPDELVTLSQPSFSYPIVQEVAARSQLLTGTFGWTLDPFDIAWGRETSRSLVWLASGTAFATLGVDAALGRLFDTRDDHPGAPPVAVLSDDAWRRRFGADREAIGRLVHVRGQPVTIIGVTPPGFFGVAPGRSPDLMVPVTLAPRLWPEDGDILGQPARAWLHVMARRRASLVAASAEFRVIWPQALAAAVDPAASAERRAEFLGRESNLEDGRLGFSSVRNQFRYPLELLAVLSGLLWLVGCAAVATLMVAGAWGRSRELAVRMALGCGRARLARQLWFEGLLVSAAAVAVATLAAPWLAVALVSLLTTVAEPVTIDFVMDWRLGIFLLALVAGTAALVSLVPMLVAARVEPGPALKSGSRVVTEPGRRGAPVLVAAQTMFCVVLLVGAGLLLRSLGHLLAVDPGVEAERLLVAELDPSAVGRDETDPTPRIDTLVREAEDRLVRLPGVLSVAYAMYPPLSDEDGSWTQSIGVDGEAPVQGEAATYFNAISPGYFDTVGTRLLAGREFRDTDSGGGPRVVIINATLAARAFSGGNPLGRRITIGRHADRQNLTIVGVVADATYQRLQEARRPVAYLPHRQTAEARAGQTIFFVVRTSAPPLRHRAEVQSTLDAVEPRATARVEPLTERVRVSLVTERVLAVLSAGLAASAVVLVGAAIFGVLSHLVIRRTPEIGIRLALGGSRVEVIRPVIGQALGMVAAGVVGGTIAAGATAGLLRGLIHGVEPTDPWTYAAAAGLMLATAIAASVIPARRAAAVNPVLALRVE